jgi:hypothetical protein
MLIIFKRTGGFMNRTLSARLDTGTQPPNAASEVERLVQEANFFHLPASLDAQPPGPDSFQYELTVRAGDQVHTVRTSDESAPEKLYSLIDYLVLYAENAA